MVDIADTSMDCQEDQQCGDFKFLAATLDVITEVITETNGYGSKLGTPIKLDG